MVSLDEVREYVATLDPATMNPMNDDLQCVYTGKDGSHCIAGEIVSHFGYPLPSIDDSRNHEVTVGGLPQISHYFGLNAISYMNQLQMYADDASRGRDPNAWGFAIDTVKEILP